MSNIKLHIGGKQPHPDWKILDIDPRPEVDFVCDASNLSIFADDSITVMRKASHAIWRSLGSLLVHSFELLPSRFSCRGVHLQY